MSEVDDYGTPELGKRFTIVPKLTRGLYGYNAKVVDEHEIDRMLLRDEITGAQHSILEAFVDRLHAVGFLALRSPEYDARISGDPSIIADNRAKRLRRIVRVFMALDRKVGHVKRRALVDLCLQERPWNGDKPSLSDAVRVLGSVLMETA